MELQTARFGSINYEKSDIIRMVRGLIGFEDLQSFVIVSLEGQEPFKWCQSIDNPEIAFLIIDPLFFKPDYRVEVHPHDIAILGADSPEEISLFVLVTIPKGKPEKMSANLQGPLAINRKNNYAAQLVLNDSSYGVAHSIFDEIENRLAEMAV